MKGIEQAETPRVFTPTRWVLILTMLWLLVFTSYGLTDRRIKIIDVQGVIRLPISLLNEGDLYLDEFAETLRRYPGVTLVRDGHLVSAFPFWPAFQLVPTYAVYGLWRGIPAEETLWEVQRRAAQASMALTVILVGCLVGRRYGWKVSVVTSLALGFGSINWFVLSQLSFSNGLVELWVALALVVGLWRLPPSRGTATASLVLLVIATFFRLNMSVFALAWGGYVVFKLRWKAVLPVVVAAAVGMAMAVGNEIYIGHPLGFYGMMSSKESFPSPTLALAVYGNLLSPSRGLLVFSPWALLAFVGLLHRRDEERAAIWALALGCLAHLVLTSNFTRWHGGGSMGPRLTADLLPVWAVLAAGGFAWCRGRRWAQLLAGIAVAASVVVAAGHAFSNSQTWEYTPVTTDVAPDRLFDWRDALVFDPFRSTPYEARYPIQQTLPHTKGECREEVVVFIWHDTRGTAQRYLVDISLKHLPRGIRVTVETFDSSARDRLVLASTSLPGTFDQRQLMAWRVRGLDKRGKVVSISGWRTFSWTPTAEAQPPSPSQDQLEPDHMAVSPVPKLSKKSTS